MRRLAIFVEGYTEVLFVEKLIKEIAGAHRVVLETIAIRGGANVPRTVRALRTPSAVVDEPYYVLIVDCGGDHLVAQRVREQHEHLTKAGYERIIALRDVRPQFHRSELSRLELGLRKYIKTSLSPVVFILAVMEIEAWFLSENSHFSRVDPSITVDRIRSELGFDPEGDMSLRDNPFDDMAACYALGGKAYEKPAEQTTLALDYERVYVELPNRIPYLKALVDELDSFVS